MAPTWSFHRIIYFIKIVSLKECLLNQASRRKSKPIFGQKPEIRGQRSIWIRGIRRILLDGSFLKQVFKSRFGLIHCHAQGTFPVFCPLTSWINCRNPWWAWLGLVIAQMGAAHFKGYIFCIFIIKQYSDMLVSHTIFFCVNHFQTYFTLAWNRQTPISHNYTCANLWLLFTIMNI